MIRLRLTSVIATLFLRASAATAYAECAWVLWEQVTSSSSDSGVNERPWKIVRAMPKHDACEADKAETIKRIVASYPKRQDVIVTAENDGLIARFNDAAGNFRVSDKLFFQCLPDTVDPHGPKGK